ncbi:MAG: hypothetical protein IJ106_02530 [Parasporobacterium sp.]|nr:hypothetical protein [Parasporobacterium sp.]
MKILGNLIPVSARMTGIENGDYFPDGPNGIMEASREEAAGSPGFAVSSAASAFLHFLQQEGNRTNCRRQKISMRELFDSGRHKIAALQLICRKPVPDMAGREAGYTDS